jgi:hypothetical protein
MASSIIPNVNVKYDDPNHLFTAQDQSLITKDIQAAVKLDTAALQVHQGATINLMVHADPSVTEVTSAPSTWVPSGTPGVLQSAAEVVINTGQQPTISHPWQDGDMYLNPKSLQGVFLNPDPVNHPEAAVPGGKVDAVSLFAHEFIHVLGVEGFLDQQAITPPSSLSTQSNFDQLVRFGASGPSFNGPSAEAQNGGQPVELTAGNLYHVGDATHFAGDLMNGDHIYTGTHYQPSALDNAILADLGYHLNPADHILAGFV